MGFAAPLDRSQVAAEAVHVEPGVALPAEGLSRGECLGVFEEIGLAYGEIGVVFRCRVETDAKLARQ